LDPHRREFALYLRDVSLPGAQGYIGLTESFEEITMKNPMEVLRIKEQEIARVKKEIDALRIAAQLCGEETQPTKGQPVDLRKALDVH
jgi:hypothetical protein